MTSVGVGHQRLLQHPPSTYCGDIVHRWTSAPERSMLLAAGPIPSSWSCTHVGAATSLHQRCRRCLSTSVRAGCEPDRERSLRVEIHEQDPAACPAQGGAEVDSGRGLAPRPSWLPHRDNAGGAMLKERIGIGGGKAEYGRPVGPSSPAGGWVKRVMPPVPNLPCRPGRCHGTGLGLRALDKAPARRLAAYASYPTR